VDRINQPPSVGMQAFIRHRAKRFEKVIAHLPLHRDWYGLNSLPIGKSNFYNLKDYSQSELKHLREVVARLNRRYRVQFHSIKHLSTLEVARVA
jgi:hypothetical protein